MAFSQLTKKEQRKAIWQTGVFLAWRQIKRASKWTTLLIISIMMLTFLNLVVTSGILVGLIEGASRDTRTQYSGDILLTTLPAENTIKQSETIIDYLEAQPEIKHVLPRYLGNGDLEANFTKVKDPNGRRNSTGVIIAGIDPIKEAQGTTAGNYVVQGRNLLPEDRNKVLIGAGYLAGYSVERIPGEILLENVEIGSQLRLTVGGVTRTVEVVGILDSKIFEVTRRIFIPAAEAQSMFEREAKDRSEIAIILHDPATQLMPVLARLRQAPLLSKNAIVKDWQEAQGQALKDIAGTFAVLGTMIGSIGLAIASITIFIIIFINAVNRRKYIGIMKAIGIKAQAVEIAYAIQSVVYAVIGSLLGFLILYSILIPYVAANPIDFPFSDGILVAPIGGTLIRGAIMIIVTIFAGYLPARMIIKQTTIGVILGR